MTFQSLAADIRPEMELFTEPMPAAQPLPRRQDLVLRLLIRHEPDGITADEAGAALHEAREHTHRYRHSADTRCRFCGQDGTGVLRALQKKRLVTRRRDGQWTLPGPRAKRERAATRDQAAARTPSVDERGPRFAGGPGDLPEGF